MSVTNTGIHPVTGSESPPPSASATTWADPLSPWYAEHGRHTLPWRHTRDPWGVLVSEVMLQQTAVARVLPRWHPFLERWPDPAACAAAPLEEILRFWAGLGYPRRARGLLETARRGAERGWPVDEAGLRRLPGVGAYTARALLVLAFDADGPPPRDVNVGRLAARAGLGVELHQTPARRLEAVLSSSRPADRSARDHTLALFDLGATVCTAAAPGCPRCPLRSGCASAARLWAAPPPRPPRRQAAYAGSQRQLRGAVLSALLDPAPPQTRAELHRRVANAPAARRPGAVEAALLGLRKDALVPPAPAEGPDLLLAT
ncbi:MAG TPA: A/G-specific adenine glycosylase [Candidatus Dormibacteraeota bacterium]